MAASFCRRFAAGEPTITVANADTDGTTAYAVLIPND